MKVKLKLFSGLMEYLPPPLTPPLLRWQSQRAKHNPLMNVAVSSVPGPRRHGHIGGAPVSEIYSIGVLSAGSAFNSDSIDATRSGAARRASSPQAGSRRGRGAAVWAQLVDAVLSTTVAIQASGTCFKGGLSSIAVSSLKP